jgi:glycosyltransferase involved in cell wall biosynthesis
VTDGQLRVAVVTPVRDRGDLVAETVRSVLTQTAVLSGRVRLDYVIVDGASSDATVVNAEAAAVDVAGQMRVVSEPDDGMYDALAKGFAVTDGDVCCYLNAGDLWMPWALDLVLDVFEQRPDVHWLCGFYGGFNAAGQMTNASLPFRFRRRLLLAGLYDGLHLPMVQQETTFWRGSLMPLLDLQRLSSFKLAGDFYLWRQFATTHELFVVQALLGGWRGHGEHLGSNSEAYREEMRRIAGRVSWADRQSARLEHLGWSLPGRVRTVLARHSLLTQHADGSWY